MKIAYVCDVYGEANNGTVIATDNLINHLRSRGHEVYVVSPAVCRNGEKDHYYVSSMNLGSFINKVVERNGVTLAKPDKPVLRSVIAKSDVVFIQVPFALGKAGARMAKEMGKPLLASFHCQAENFTSHIFMMHSPLINHLTYKYFYRGVFRRCDAIHYPTEFIKNLFYKHTKINVPSYVISNGVNPAFFEPIAEEDKIINDKFTIVCSGRYSKEKAQEVLLRAVAHSRHRDEIRVILAGEGPKKAIYENYAKNHGVDCVFNFYKQEELMRVLKSADLYVHTATVEIEAISCTEAIASGLVALICASEKSATKAFAADEWTKFKKYDSKALTAKIDALFEDRTLLDYYKRKYKEAQVVMPLGECMDRMEKMIEAVAAR